MAKEAIPYGGDPSDAATDTAVTGGVVGAAAPRRRVATALQAARKMAALDVAARAGGAAVAQEQGLLPRCFATL